MALKNLDKDGNPRGGDVDDNGDPVKPKAPEAPAETTNEEKKE